MNRPRIPTANINYWWDDSLYASKIKGWLILKIKTLDHQKAYHLAIIMIFDHDLPSVFNCKTMTMWSSENQLKTTIFQITNLKWSFRTPADHDHFDILILRASEGYFSKTQEVYFPLLFFRNECSDVAKEASGSGLPFAFLSNSVFFLNFSTPSNTTSPLVIMSSVLYISLSSKW